MSDEELRPLFDGIGRVVFNAAQLEQALATFAMATAGGDEAAFKASHGQFSGPLVKRIEKAAADRSGEWWSADALELMPLVRRALSERHEVVHGHWSDLESIVSGTGYLSMKPDRASGQWRGGKWDRQRLVECGANLEALLHRVRDIADRLLDQVTGRMPPPAQPAWDPDGNRWPPLSARRLETDER